ncbi:hypothetical protein A3K70_00195 [Candidatus Bathyarchaeota archaeon RBG_16_48_13]|nr:MAG: hypothetical protein A3K70_00195 [Candidatus Bathyarchaeota archaeon RBG_16_48_13]
MIQKYLDEGTRSANKVVSKIEPAAIHPFTHQPLGVNKLTKEFRNAVIDHVRRGNQRCGNEPH